MDLFRAAEVAIDVHSTQAGVGKEIFMAAMCPGMRARAHGGPPVAQQVCLRDRTDWFFCLRSVLPVESVGLYSLFDSDSLG